MKRQLLVSVETDYDPMGIEAEHPDAEAVNRDELHVAFVIVRVVDVGKLTEVQRSLSGISVTGLDDPYLLEVEGDLTAEALQEIR
jgi:hypothetical protein